MERSSYQYSNEGNDYEQKSTLLHLPDSLLLKIFSNLTHLQLCKIASVCNHFSIIAFDKQLWRRIDISQHKHLTKDRILQVIRHKLPSSLNLIDLSGCAITRTIIDELSARFHSLETLLLQNCTSDHEDDNMNLSLPHSLVQLDVRNFKSHKHLAHLMQQVNKVKTLQCLAFTGITTMHLDEETDSFLRHIPSSVDFHKLAQLKSLRILECIDCDIVTDTEVSVIVGQLHNLVSLSLKDCEGVTGSTLNDMLKSTRHLKALNLSGTKLTDHALASTAWECSCLEEIDLSYCVLVTDEGLSNSLGKIKDLHYLALNHVGKGKAVTAELFEKLATCRPWENITTLSLYLSNRLPSNALSSLRHCRHLSHVSFRACPRISFGMIAEHVEFLPNLLWLECGSITVLPFDGTVSSLNTSHCSWINLVEKLSVHCVKLRHLTLLKCVAYMLSVDVCEEKISRLLEHCVDLESVCVLRSKPKVEEMFRRCVELVENGKDADDNNKNKNNCNNKNNHSNNNNNRNNRNNNDSKRPSITMRRTIHLHTTDSRTHTNNKLSRYSPIPSFVYSMEGEIKRCKSKRFSGY